MSNLYNAVRSLLFNREYAIIKDGKELLWFQAFGSLDAGFEATTTTQPVEQDSFFSANKVASPQTFTAELFLQGDKQEIMQAIEVLEKEVKDATLVQILTPFYITPKATVTKLSWTHKEQIGMLAVSLQLQEIKEVSAQYTNTEVKPVSKKQAKNASDASTVDGGQVQGKTPRKSVLTQLGF